MVKVADWLESAYSRLDRLSGGRLTVLVRAGLAFDQDSGAVKSRSIAYYALFSLFPLILVLMTVAGSLLSTEEAQELVLSFLDAYFPSTLPLLEANIGQVMETQSTVSILAILGLLWSASGVFTAIYRSVNLAWNNPKSKLFWTEKLFGLAVVLVFGMLLLASTLLSTAVGVVRSWRALFVQRLVLGDADLSWLFDWPSNLISILISMVSFVILYRVIPRNKVTWRDVWVGGLLVGLVWEAARQIYTWYLSNFASYSLIYGSVGAIIGFLLWAYLSAMILLLGAAFTAQHTYWRRAGRPIETRPLREWMATWSKEDLTWENP